MSISKFQDKFLSQKGCGAAIAVGICFVMGAFLLNSFGRFGNSNDQQRPGAGAPAVTVADVPISGQAIGQSVTQMMTQQASMMGRSAPPPNFATGALVAPYAIQQALSSAAVQVVAERHHVSLSDENLTKAYKTYLEQNQPAPVKKDPAQNQKMTEDLTRFQSLLADPEKRASIASGLAPILLTDTLSASISVTNDQVKRLNATYEVKRIFIATKPGADPATKANDALKAIKGGMSFEAAMDKFSNDLPPAPGKKISDSKIDIPESQVISVPAYKDFDAQKPGFVSGPIVDAGGVSVYKLVSVKENVPKDFATNLEKYKKQYIQQIISPKIEAEVKAILASGDVKWNSPGYKAIFDLSEATKSPNPLGNDDAIQKVIDEAKAAMKSPSDKVPALYAWFNAETQLYSRPGADKAKMRPARIELLQAVLQDSEDYSLRMELIDLDIQQKDGAGALSNLVQASEANATYDAVGQDHFRDIGAKGASLLTLKLIKPDDLKALNDAQGSWRKSKADEDKMAAQTKVEQAQEKVKQAEQDKVNAAEIARQKKEAASLGKPVKPGAAPSTPVTPAAPPRMGQ